MGIESRIDFVQRTDQFFPGSVFSGTVVLQLEDDVSARYVKILLVGEAKTHWEHRHSIRVAGQSRTVTEYYKGLVPIIESERILWGNGEKEELPAGEHHFTFQFQVPMECFPEFHSRSGSIYYYCKLIVDRPWKFDHTNEQKITVTPIYDICAAPPQLLQPKTTGSCEKIGLPLFRRGEVAVTVNLSKTAFTVGETIHATVQIDNRTSKDVENVKLILCQYADFVAFQDGAKFPTNVPFIESDGKNVEDSKAEITSSETDVVCPSRGNTVVEAFLEVPNIAPTFECAIIKVQYKLMVEVDTTSTFLSSVDCKVPIVIFNGNFGYNIGPPQPLFPIADFVQQTDHVAPPMNEHSGSVTPSAPPLYPPLGQICEPPPPYTPSETETDAILTQE